jgi:hypothetical protein
MNPSPFAGMTSFLGKPKNWRPQFGTCRELAIQEGETIIPGIHTMTSLWIPTDSERLEIAGGHNIELIICGRLHPAVALRVSTLNPL